MPATDEFGGHEVLHTAHLIDDLFYRQIVEHAYVQADADLKNAAEAVHKQLAEFYQLVGNATDRAPQ